MFRSQEGPMDFEFQNGTGPVDARSPFAQVTRDTQRFPPSNKKRSYSAFDSPTKSKPSHLSSPSKPLPPTPAYNSLFTTPRKTNNDIDDSSAGNTPVSPEREPDSDATPENMGLRSAMSRLGAVSMPTIAGAERSNSPVKERPELERRESWLSTQLTKAKNKFSSPGRGEIPRAEHSGAIEKRTTKRRKREVDRIASRRRRHSVSDSGEDSEMPPRSPRKTSRQHAEQQEAPKESWIGALYTFIERHPMVPHIASQYVQLGLNIFLIFCVASIIWTGWSAVQSDIDKKANEAAAGVMAEMAACAAQYTANKCDRSTRVPAMETVCENWSLCMNRDPMAVGRGKVGATVFAEIYNSFVEQISWKAFGFTAIMVFGCFFITNFAFSIFRRTEGHVPGYQQQYYQPPVPPTPQRQFSGQDGGFYVGTPWQQQPALEPQPSGGFGQIDGRGSPVRRIQW